MWRTPVASEADPVIAVVAALADPKDSRAFAPQARLTGLDHSCRVLRCDPRGWLSLSLPPTVLNSGLRLDVIRKIDIYRCEVFMATACVILAPTPSPKTQHLSSGYTSSGIRGSGIAVVPVGAKIRHR